MLLGIPFHLSLIYSTQSWSVNSEESRLWLTLTNDFIHSFRMQVFFVISGYFSYMLYLRYQSGSWLKVRLKRIGIPLLASIPLITLPQFFIIYHWTDNIKKWDTLSWYSKYLTSGWNLISHLWFLVVLAILTMASMVLFKFLCNKHHIRLSSPNWLSLSLSFLLTGIIWASIHRLVFIFYPGIMADGLFNIGIMKVLFFLPFFLLGALAWQYPALKALFIKFNPWLLIAAVATFIAYVANLRFNFDKGWLYEMDAIITMLMGLWMVNLVFSFGHRFLSRQSKSIAYLVNASLFIYLVHHPLTLLYGIFITPRFSNPGAGFFTGLLVVSTCCFLLYEIHRRIPLLRFLFSGKSRQKKAASNEG